MLTELEHSCMIYLYTDSLLFQGESNILSLIKNEWQEWRNFVAKTWLVISDLFLSKFLCMQNI